MDDLEFLTQGNKSKMTTKNEPYTIFHKECSRRFLAEWGAEEFDQLESASYTVYDVKETTKYASSSLKFFDGNFTCAFEAGVFSEDDEDDEQFAEKVEQARQKVDELRIIVNGFANAHSRQMDALVMARKLQRKGKV